MSLPLNIAVVVLLIAVSAFFSVAEIALASARKLRLQSLADAGDARAAEVIALQERPGHFFTVVQIGLNSVAILGGLLAEGALSPLFSRLIVSLGGAPDVAATGGFALSFVLITALFIECADLIPKRIGMAEPERWAMRLVRPMRVCTRVLAPLVVLFNGVADAFFRITGLPAAREERVTADDIVAVGEAGADAGALRGDEHQLIGNVLGFGERPVAAALTPRDSVVYLDLDEDAARAREKILTRRAEDFLVCRGRIDEVVGFIELRDLLPALADASGAALTAALNGPAVRAPAVVPESLTLADVLERFRVEHTDFAVVVNEYALVVGTVTLDDLMHCLMDRVVVAPGERQVVQRGPGSWLVDGMAPIDEVKRLIDVDAVPGEGAYATAAGFMMFMMKRVPDRAEGFEFAGHRFEAVDIDNYRIDQLMVTRIETPPAG